MKILSKGKSSIFREIHIQDSFISKYLKDMPSEVVKLYIYLKYLEEKGKETDLIDIAKDINMKIDVVKSSLEYLQEKGLTIITTEGYYIVDLREKELIEMYTPRVTANIDEIKNSKEKSKDKREVIEMIETEYFGGNMNAEWYKKIIFWFEKYNFENEAMLGIFAHCFSSEAKPIAYVETVIKAMYDKGVLTYKDFEREIKSHSEVMQIIKYIRTEMNIPKQLTKPQERLVTKWIKQYGYGKKEIEILLSKTTNSQTAGFNYLDKIITEWHENGLKTPQEIESFEEQRKGQVAPNRNKTTRAKIDNSGHGFSSREEEDFSLFYLLEE